MILFSIFLTLFVCIYLMTILLIIRGKVDSFLVKFFCYRTTALKELQSFEERLRKVIKTIYIISMALNLVILFSFIYYLSSGYSQSPIIFFFIPINQLVTPIIIFYLVKAYKKHNQMNK